MFTSYFSILNKFPELADKSVAISRGVPRWYNGRIFEALAPPWDLIKIEDPDEYRRRYFAEVLSRLDPAEVFKQLGEDSILLCWEKLGEFCHRRIVAEWLKSNVGIEVPEWGLLLRQEVLF